MKPITTFIRFVTSFDTDSKVTFIGALQEKFHLTIDRKVFYNNSFAVRISYSKNGSFSNTILSLSTLQKYDNKPVFVVLVCKGKPNRLYLCNSTFLTKVSHSSQALAMDNIRGSFNGSDIIKEYQGIINCGENFDELYAYHRAFTWEENLQRLVYTTHNIRPSKEKFHISEVTHKTILKSIDLADNFIHSENFKQLCNELDGRVRASYDAILCASHIENVNVRGRLIEVLITSDGEERTAILKALKEDETTIPTYITKNEIGDFCRTYNNGVTYTDIKTKIIYLNSNPKGYNIDKFLEVMSEGNSIFFFYFIGIDEKGIVNKTLVSTYHNLLIPNIVIQPHWSGRATRGETQLIGTAIDKILSDVSFNNTIDKSMATTFLEKLMAL